MMRAILIMATALLLFGCESKEAKRRTYYERRGRYVNVNVSEGSVDVEVRPEDGEDTDVHVRWPD